ncbi:DUF4062 domain-containing protein [bacterium]|nr:DUF4062 domain-containing protein [bacterium]
MEKKYQVFISSTFTDLINERREIYNAILTAGCFPAGMESFVATDDEQFSVIKKVIDLCDYYVLIIGGRYGSINEKTGISYTEMEYDYAISKGIPVLVFARSNTEKLSSDYVDTDSQKKEKLIIFKNKAMKNRLANLWDDINDLKFKVAMSIVNAIRDIERPGWIRGDSISLDKENDVFSVSTNENYDYLNKEITINFTEIMYSFTPGKVVDEKQLTFTYRDIYKHISGGLTAMVEIAKFKDLVNSLCKGYYTDSATHNKIKAFFVGKGLIKSENVKNKNAFTEIVGLTEKGLSLMGELSE